MGLSFVLTELALATPLQAFSAGAALSATSLGTTFTILSTTQLTTTRLGTVTTSAAMLDDVVGLVMVQIISNLGGNSSFSAVTVVRPVFVSLGFAIGLLLLCAFCLQPVLRILVSYRASLPDFTGSAQFAFLAQTCVLVGIVAGATYAGTSSLFAAYLAGVIVSWFDGLVAESKQSTAEEPSPAQVGSTAPQENVSPDKRSSNADGLDMSGSRTTQQAEISQHVTGEVIYQRYYKEPTNRILLPLFFVSSLDPNLGNSSCEIIVTNTTRHPSDLQFQSPRCSPARSSGAA